MGIRNIAMTVGQAAAKKKEEEERRQTAQNRKSTDTRANSGGAAKRTGRRTAYYSGKKVGAAQAVAQQPKVQAKARTAVRPSYYRTGTIPNIVNPLEQLRQGKKYYSRKESPDIKAANRILDSQAGDAGEYVRPPDWTWDDDVAQLAKDRRVERIENYTNDFRVLEENPLKQLEASVPAWRRAYRERYGYTKSASPPSVMERIKDSVDNAVRIETRRKEMMDEAAPFRDWVDSRTHDFTEDKGTTLAQVNRLASLYGAIEPTTRGYTPEQAKQLHREILNAPVDLQELYIKYQNSLSPIVRKKNNSAYFKPLTGRVYGDPAQIASNTMYNLPMQTHWHEYGHNLDWLSNEYNGLADYSSSYAKDGKTFNDIITEDWDRTLRDYWKTFKGNEPYDVAEALSSLGNDVWKAYPRGEQRNFQALSDLLSPYSVARGGDAYPLGAGHSARYWSQDPNLATAEAFADIASASVGAGDSLRYIQAFMPNTYAAYLDMLDQMTRTSYKQKSLHK